MNNTIKYFLYARKSSEGEDRQVTSIEDQISEVSKLAENLNIEIVDIIEESKSAKEPGRKEFNNMIKRIKKGEAKGVLCWKLNRLARNSIDGGNIIHLLQKNVIQHIQTFGRDYKPTDNVIMMYVEFGMANQYVNDLSVDVRRGMRKKAERGWHPQMKLAVGYIHNPNKNDKDKEIIIDENSFYKIKKLWKLMLTGQYSIADIKREADILNLINRNGKYYSANTYHKMFRNEFYCGYFYWLNDNKVRIKYFGKHTPMITELEFLKVQKILQKNSNPTQKQKYFFPYRGLIACGECKGFVTCENKLQAICTHCKYKFSLKTKSFCPKCKTDISKMKNPSMIDKTYYHCTKKVKKDCSQGSITDNKVEEFIIKNLQEISIHNDFFEFMLKALKQISKTYNSDDEKILKPLIKRKDELITRLDNLIQMRADNEISKDQLLQFQKENKEEIEAINLKILSFKHIQTNWYKVAIEQLNFARHSLKKFEKATDFTKKMIASKLGSNLILNNKSLYFKRVKALYSISNCSKKYNTEIDRLELKNPIVNKGDFNYFNYLFPLLSEDILKIRTCLIDNIKENLA
jgi:DNA invertase Pin-like site-specific DNA recombinase